MPNQKVFAALPLAALFAAAAVQAPPASAAGQEGIVVARDAQTGELRQPTPAEMHALARQPASGRASAAAAPPASFVRQNGTRGVRLGERAMVYQVVTRDAEGRLVQQCVQGERAALEALAKPAPAAHEEEHRHE